MMSNVRRAAVLLTFLLSACSGTPSEGDGTCDAGCSSGQTCRTGKCVTPSGDDGGSYGPDGGSRADGSTDGGSDDAGSACAMQTTKAQRLPLDIYIMLDKSTSMDDDASSGVSKWTAVTNAIETFLSQPDLDDVSVGLQYFPLYEGGWFGDMSCKASDYATPAVAIDSVSTVKSAILRSIDATRPNGNTPTIAALEGAIDYAKSWAQSKPQHVVIDIFATDGQPHGICNNNMDDITAIAANGVKGTPSIRTFVIGVTTPNDTDLTDNLNAIADKGGSGTPFLVDTSQDVDAKFLEALNKIRGAALGCTYSMPVPKSGEADLTRLAVQYKPSSGSVQIFRQVADKASCPASGNGWYLDNATAPKKVILCSATCTLVSADPGGEVDILVTCKGGYLPPPT